MHWAALGGASLDLLRGQDVVDVEIFSPSPLLSFLLIEADADPNARTLNGQTAMHWAVSSDNVAGLRMLHKYGGQLDGADDRRTSLVMFACQHGAMKCLLYLRRRGIDMSVTDCGGDTPGHWAAFAGSPTAIQLLHHWGVDFSIKDDEGFTPLDRARQAQHIDCVHLLETRIVPQPPKSEEYTILGLAVHLFRRYLLNYVPCLMLAAFMATQACIWTYSMRAGGYSRWSRLRVQPSSEHQD